MQNNNNNNSNHNLLSRISRDDLEKILRFSPGMIFIHVKGSVVYANDSAITFFGSDISNPLIGRSIWNIYSVDLHGIVRARIQKVLEEKEPVPFIEMTVKAKDNKHAAVECASLNINYDGSLAVAVVMRDISYKKESQDLLGMQYSISKNLVTNTSLENALMEANKSICMGLHSDLSRVWVLSGKYNVLTCVAAWIMPSQLKNDDTINMLKPSDLKLETDDGYIIKCFRTAEPSWSQNDNGFYKTIITIPLRYEQNIIGVLEILFEKNMFNNDRVFASLLQSAYQISAYIKRKIYEKDLIYLSYHDTVTGLINRSLFEQTIESEIQLAINNDQKIALLMFDINNFRDLNIRLGHMAGDVLLRSVADRIISAGFTIEHTSRIENDRFVIILHNVQGVKYLKLQINKINDIFKEKFKIFDNEESVTVNIGVAQFPEDGSNSVELMRSADIALTVAAKAGSSQVQLSSRELTYNAYQDMNMANSIRDALANDEFHLEYQPIIDCKNFMVVGFEALLRWEHGGTAVPTSVFIPLIAKSGLFPLLRGWIIRTACEQCKLWQKQVSRLIYVSVNLTSSEFRDSNLLLELKNTLSELELEPQSLTLEITESTLMEDKEIGLQIVNEIRNLGIRIAIDDFGAGYSSLNYLVHLSMDFVKIDKLFIDDICLDKKVTPIIQAAIGLGAQIGYKAIAEGVESKEQTELLLSLGCPYIQGYYFSKPMVASDVFEFLKQTKINI